MHLDTKCKVSVKIFRNELRISKALFYRIGPIALLLLKFFLGCLILDHLLVKLKTDADCCPNVILDQSFRGPLLMQ